MLYELGRFFLLSIHHKITKTLQGALFLSTGAENHRSSVIMKRHLRDITAPSFRTRFDCELGEELPVEKITITDVDTNEITEIRCPIPD